MKGFLEAVIVYTRMLSAAGSRKSHLIQFKSKETSDIHKLTNSRVGSSGFSSSAKPVRVQGPPPPPTTTLLGLLALLASQCGHRMTAKGPYWQAGQALLMKRGLLGGFLLRSQEAFLINPSKNLPCVQTLCVQS